MTKSNPNLAIGQKVRFGWSKPDKPDAKCSYGTITGIYVDPDDGVSYTVKEDYKRTRNTMDTEKLKLVRGPITLHESKVRADNIYVGKRVVANWPEKKCSRIVRVYWWYDNHVLVGPEDVVTDKPQAYQIVDRSQLEDHNLVSVPPDHLLYAGIISAFELMCQYGLVGSEKLEDVVEVVKACGTNGARRALKQYAANKGYGASHTLAEAIRTEQWEASKIHTMEVPNTAAENVKRSGDIEHEATKQRPVPLLGVCNLLGVPAGMSGLTTLEFRVENGRVREETIDLCHKPDPIKQGDAVAVSPDGKPHKMNRDRVEQVAKKIGVPVDVIINSDVVTIIKENVVVSQTTDQFISTFDFETRPPLNPCQGYSNMTASEAQEFIKRNGGDTFPDETKVACGGPLVSASVVKEKDDQITCLVSVIRAKNERLAQQGEKISRLNRELKAAKALINPSPGSVVTTVNEVITTHNKMMRLQTEVERLEHVERNNLASIDAAHKRESRAVAEADAARKELQIHKNHVAQLKKDLAAKEQQLTGVQRRLDTLVMNIQNQVNKD